VLDAVQAMRKRAQAAGNLKSTSQQTVTTSEETIVIEPAAPETVYLPQYDPWQAYGAPVAVYPGWVPYTGLYVNGPGIFFGLGLGLGLFAGVGWGWHHWGADWHDHRLMHDRAPYVAHSAAFGFHGGGVPQFHAGGVPRPDVIRGGTAPRGAEPHGAEPHGAEFHSAEPHGMESHGTAPHGLHSGAFSGVDHGGVARANSFRGQSSFGGGFHGGGAAGGFHGGGFHGGGAFHAGGGGFHGGGGRR
jgi:hypothetical protein